MGSHSVTCHLTQVNAPRLTPAMQAGTRFMYPGGMEGWVDLVHLIAPRPGVEPATFRSRVRRRTAAPPRQPINCLPCVEHDGDRWLERGDAWWRVDMSDEWCHLRNIWFYLLTWNSSFSALTLLKDIQSVSSPITILLSEIGLTFSTPDKFTI